MLKPSPLKTLFITSLLALSATHASAKEVALNGKQIQQLLTNQTVKGFHFKKETRQYFAKSGLTLWIGKGDAAPSEGRWKIDNNRYCSSWNGLFSQSPQWSCYQVTEDKKQGIYYFSAKDFKVPFIISEAFDVQFVR